VAEYALILILLIVTYPLIRWAFLPARFLPGHRARILQVRLLLRLHPGKGFATLFGLHLRWGRLAALRRSHRIRPSLPRWLRALAPSGHSVFLGRAHLRHSLRVPLEEHVLVMAPPRTGKTAFLADVILRYPGPVISTTTKADVFAPTAGVRSFSAARSTRVPDTTTLEAASTLCGDASWKIRGEDHRDRHPVAPPDMIRQLPTGTALVIRGGNAPSSPGSPAPGTTPPTAAPASQPPP
jgi:hypothetical protein